MKTTWMLAGAAAAGTALGAMGTTATAQNLAGTVNIDGSSTVYPITEAVAEEFAKDHPNVRVTVGISGTGGGFKRFAIGETDISNASRPIKGAEAEAARSAGVEFIEIPVAYDGLSVVVNPSNTFVDKLTVEQLQQIYRADLAAKMWSDLDPSWPAQPIKVYSPGTDSGTFDYFREVAAPEKGQAMRSDMSVSEDDNVLVNGVSGDPNAIGYFGLAYYEENKDKLRVVPIVNPETGEAVEPTPATVESGEYAPLSRPLFVYVNAKSASRPEVKEFVEFYLENAADLAAEVGYISLPEGVYNMAESKFTGKKTGSAYLKDGKKVEGPVTEVYGTK